MKGLKTSNCRLTAHRPQQWPPQGPERHTARNCADLNRETTYCSAAPSEIYVLHFAAVACQRAADEPKAGTEKQNYPEIDILLKKKKKVTAYNYCNKAVKKKKKGKRALMYQKLRLPLQFKKAGDRQTL